MSLNFEIEKHEKMKRKSHTDTFYNMDVIEDTDSGTVIDSNGPRMAEQQPFQDAIQQIKDARAGLFQLSGVRRIKCSESGNVHDHFDKCTVHFSHNRTQEFFDVNTIHSMEKNISKISSTQEQFEIHYANPSQVNLFTWKGALADLNPHAIRKAILEPNKSKRLTKDQKHELWLQNRFIQFAKKNKLKGDLHDFTFTPEGYFIRVEKKR